MLLFRELPVVMDKKVRTGAGSNEAELRECLGKELEVLEGEESDAMRKVYDELFPAKPTRVGRTPGGVNADGSKKTPSKPTNIVSEIIEAKGFPEGWRFSVSCRFFDKKVINDKYWHAPDTVAEDGVASKPGKRYRSYKEIDAAFPGISYDKEIFAACVEKEVGSLTEKLRVKEAEMEKEEKEEREKARAEKGESEINDDYGTDSEDEGAARGKKRQKADETVTVVQAAPPAAMVGGFAPPAAMLGGFAPPAAMLGGFAPPAAMLGGYDEATGMDTSEGV